MRYGEFRDRFSVSAFRIVHVPRVWDDPARQEAEKNTHGELDEVARTFRAAFDAGTERISALATWIRYSPPSPGAKPAEPWFDDAADDDNDDPDRKPRIDESVLGPNCLQSRSNRDFERCLL